MLAKYASYAGVGGYNPILSGRCSGENGNADLSGG